jgi:hypothetical protein
MIGTGEISTHYLRQAFEQKPADEVFIKHTELTKVAVIIEPRFDDITEHVIYNFMHFLNPLGWNLLIISYYGYRQKIEQKCPYAFVLDIGNKHIFLDENGVPNITIYSYNTIMMDPELWEKVPGETVIIFQRDCIMFRYFSEHFLLYDYAGSNYLSNLAPLFGGINGGFSIRKRATMLECLRKITWEEIDEYRNTRKHSDCAEIPLVNKHEDVFFTHACEILCKTVPDVYSRTFLCIENDFNPQASVHHGWNKGYMSINSIVYMLNSSPLFSTVRNKMQII